jgi:hypothetical protein
MVMMNESCMRFTDAPAFFIVCTHVVKTDILAGSIDFVDTHNFPKQKRQNKIKKYERVKEERHCLRFIYMFIKEVQSYFVF